MISVAFQIDGLKELQDELKQLPYRAERRVLRNAGVSAMREARKVLIKAAPTYNGTRHQGMGSFRYGPLKKAIKVGKPFVGHRVVGAKVSTGEGFWGYFIEKGTRYHSPAPWFDPAFDAARGMVGSKWKQTAERGLKREFEKIERRVRR